MASRAGAFLHCGDDQLTLSLMYLYRSMMTSSFFGITPSLTFTPLCTAQSSASITMLVPQTKRPDSQFNQQVRPILDKKYFNEAGEVGGLYHANWLLSQRFPRRMRPYFAHVPKVITRGLHHEVSLMFKEALTTSSSRRFRELHKGEGDIQMQWLLTSLRVRPFVNS